MSVQVDYVWGFSGEEEKPAAAAGNGLLRGAGIGGNAFDEKGFVKLCETPIVRLKEEFTNLRIGRIMPGILNDIHVKTADGDYALESLGDISVKHANTLVVTLHDPSVHIYFFDLL
jgi:hypothetical protein